MPRGSRNSVPWAGELRRIYFPRLYENSGYVSNRYPTKRRKRPHRAIFRCFVLPKTHLQGFSNYFSYSLLTEFSEVRELGILRSTHQGSIEGMLRGVRGRVQMQGGGAT